MKYAWIDEQRREYPLPNLCEVLDVSVSGYRAWKRGGKPARTRTRYNPQLEAAREDDLPVAHGDELRGLRRNVVGRISGMGNGNANRKLVSRELITPDKGKAHDR